MSTICSFKLKPKLRKIPIKYQTILKPKTLGEHLRKTRMERKQAQGFVSKLLNVNQMYLSSWELNQKAPHPKHLENIIKYLGYVPNITSKSDKLGMRTKLYRTIHKMAIDEFCQMANIDSNVVIKLETMRFHKIEKHLSKAIEKALKMKP